MRKPTQSSTMGLRLPTLLPSIFLLPMWLASCMVAGCFNPGIQPRSGEILKAGEVGADGVLHVATYAPGTVKLSNGDQVNGNTGQRGIASAISIMSFDMANMVGGMRVGLGAQVELGAYAGLQQIGGNLRIGLMNEESASFSMALTLGSAWRPLVDSDLPWSELGVDLSRRLSGLLIHANVYGSYGPEPHAVGFDEGQVPECDGFGAQGCSEMGPGRHMMVEREEARLHGALGLGFLIEDPNHYVDPHRPTPAPTIGYVDISLIPYLKLYSREAKFDCFGCDLIGESLDERWGLSLKVGFHM